MIDVVRYREKKQVVEEYMKAQSVESVVKLRNIQDEEVMRL